MWMATQEPHLRSHAIEDYAKAIYVLETRGDEPVSTTALADRLHVTAGSVSAMIKKLAELDLVTHTPYRGVRLTAEGRRTALEVIRHHRLLELFLAEVLEMPWDRVHQEAEVLEHVLSTELEEIIAEKLGNPTHDPHGDPIPSSSFEIEERETRSLADLQPGDEGTFVRVSDSDSDMLRYLGDRGVTPGSSFEVLERQPFGGPLFVRFGRDVHPLGGELAQAMRVEVAQ
jgi:DtxR family transcriptional regulator, Mn-dependent transcriptional regulator